MSRIVVLDDSLTVCTFVRRILEREWYKVETYLQPLAALQALWQQAGAPPAAIVLDIQLPHLDGYEITRMLRTTAPETLRTVPIIALTARDGVLDRTKGKLLGMNAYLTKPFEPTELLAVLNALIPHPPVP